MARKTMLVGLGAVATLLVVLALLQGTGFLFPRGDRARQLCDDRRKLEAAVSAEGREDNATPEEAARLLRDYADRLLPCRTAELEAATRVHPELVAIAARSYVWRDDNLLRLVTGRISRQAWRDEDAAIAAWVASRAQILRDSLKGVSATIFGRSYASQEAQASLQEWADRQRALMQQQSALDPTARMRLMICTYDGVVLQCTTS
ncbi:MAG: hypothetical protein ACXWLB_10980 [Reyranella sp.]